MLFNIVSGPQELWFSGEILLKLRALLRASTVTNLLIARFLRCESVVDRLEKEIEVREIVQPVCPPRSNVIKPCSGHSYLRCQSTEPRLHTSFYDQAQISPGFMKKKKIKT